MTTKQAFKHLTNQRGWFNQLKNPIHPDTARSLKRNFNEDKLSEEKMTELLKDAGYKFTPANWEIKKKK